jgi:hypothetical protein
VSELEFELRAAENLLDRIAERFVERGYVRESRVLANCASAVKSLHLQMQSALTAAHEEVKSG